MKKLLIPLLAIVVYGAVMYEMEWYRELSLESIGMTIALAFVLFGVERILFILGFAFLLFLIQFFINRMGMQ